MQQALGGNADLVGRAGPGAPDRGGERVEAHVDVPAGIFDQAIGVEQETGAGCEPPLAGADGDVGAGTEQDAGRVAKVLGVTGAGDQQRWGVPRVGIDEVTGGQVENGVDRARDRLGEQPDPLENPKKARWRTKEYC